MKSINILYKCNRRYLLFALVALVALISACQPNSNTPKERWQHAVGGAYAADITNNAKFSVVSSVHQGISLWDIENNTLKFNWSHQQDSANNLVLAIDIANDNQYVLTASREDFALWNMDNGRSVGYWQSVDSPIRDIALSNKGEHVLLGKSNGTVVHITLSSGRRLEFLGHTEKINAVDMLPNGRIALSGSNDFVAFVWDTLTGQVVYRFNHPSRVTKVALDPNGQYAFTADSKKEANIWNLKTGKLISQLQYNNRQEVFSSIAFSKDGTLLVTGAPSRKVSVWDIKTGKRINSWYVSSKSDTRPAGAVVYSVAFRDNEHIITESSSGYAELWPITAH